MSRSFKKTWGFTCPFPEGKKRASRKVRQKNKMFCKIEDEKDLVPDGRKYKSVYDSWNINDWKSLAFNKEQCEWVKRKYDNGEYHLYMK